MKHLGAALVVTLSLAGTGITAYGDEGHQHKPGAKAHGQPHASALGKPGNAKNVSRSVEIAMDDSMRFNPSSIDVKKGETIRFVLKNGGKLKHEMVLGTIEELKKHAALMLKFPEMEHADPNQASVEPGKTGELIWQFTKSGNFDFACLQAGHYEAGMKGQVIVAAVAMKGQ
ncbi:MAG: cupredoxin family protein [Paracoccaceae bacterium]